MQSSKTGPVIESDESSQGTSAGKVGQSMTPWIKGASRSDSVMTSSLLHAFGVFVAVTGVLRQRVDVCHNRFSTFFM